MAVRGAGLRSKKFEGRYRLLLSQYRQSNGRPVTSCKQLNNSQVEDLLAICESHGWRHPGKPADYYRQKRINSLDDFASYAQQEAIKKLAGDLGWSNEHLGNFIAKMLGSETSSVILLTPQQAYKAIEALKSILGRQTGKQYSSLKEVQKDMEVENGQEQASQIG